MATSPLSTSTNPISTMFGSPDSHNYLKMEDLNTASSPSTFFESSTTSDGPERIVVTSKAAKKRKSWGQELPEPKTTLPPRKRAKTDDEKEQRRIERIKRNRAAAHNSRERKRQETETYAVALARAQAELKAYRKHFGMLPASVILPEVTLATVPEDEPTPAPSLIDSRSSLSAPSPASPALIDDLFEPTNVVIKQEPDVTSQNSMAAPVFEYSPPTKPVTPALSLLDSTQHPAVMLCDLPCRSRKRSSQSINPNNPSTTWWTNFLLQIMTLSLRSTYKALLLAIWSHSPSHMARMIRASQSRSTSRSTITSMTPLQLSRSTVALAQRNAATRRSVVRQGALALQQQRSVMNGLEEERGGPAAAAEQLHSHHQQNSSKAFREFRKGNGSDDRDGGLGS